MPNIIVMDSTKEKLSSSSNRSSSNCGQPFIINDPNVPRPALNGAIHKGNLYLDLIDLRPGDHSKELFITLLDKAEEAGCKNVIICLNKQASIRPFAFLGFKLLPPNHQLVPDHNCYRNMLFMNLKLENDEM